MSGLLSRPLHDLEQSDYQKFEKRIGENTPFPMVGLGYITGADGRQTPGRYLGILEEPMIVSSDLTLDEVEGELFRNLPTPDMLPMFFNVMSAVHPRNERRAMMLIGAPGAGKTFLGEMTGRVMNEKGPITIDCTGLNLNELFYETVLDFNKSQNFYKALEEKIKHYNESIGDVEEQSEHLHAYSVDRLREGLGEAFVENDKGEISIDWENIKKGHKNSDGEYLESIECIRRAKNALEWVSSKEGLDAAGGNALGMATQEGPAWQAYKEGRVLVLDEMNRAKKGTHGVIHGWMQFIIGEKTTYTFRNPMQEKGDKTAQALTFRKAEMGAGHFVFMTGNTVQDSDEVFELPEALSSRIVEERVPDATELSWQHRICQILTGVPISTHYYAQRDVWDKDPEAFGKHIMEGRLKGLKGEAPEYQLEMLRDWEKVMEASANLAKFFFHASEIVNPDSDKYKTVTDLNALLDEIDTSFKKETSVDFRKVAYFINRANLPKPIVRAPDDSVGSRITPLLTSFDVPEDPANMHEKLGTNMSYAILDWIINKTYEQGKVSLGNQLIQLATDTGIIEGKFFEAKASERRTLKTLLDRNPYDSDREEVRLEWTRDSIVNYLRDGHEGKEFTDNNDEILPVSVVKRNLEVIKADDEANLAAQSEAHAQNSVEEDQENSEAEAETTAETTIEFEPRLDNLVVPNEDISSFASEPLTSVSLHDAAPAILSGGHVETPGADDVVDQGAFLRSFTIPDLRSRNLSALFNTAVSDSKVVVSSLGEVVDEALAMAEGRSDTGLSATTVMLKTQTEAGAKLTPTHVVWNEPQDKILVVGEGAVSHSLKSAFNNSHVAYVDRLAEDAERQVTRALSEVLGAENYDHRDDLKRALLVRSTMLQSTDDDFDASLAEVLSSKKTASYLPNYVMSAKTHKPG